MAINTQPLTIEKIEQIRACIDGGLTQKQIAEQVGVSVPTISKYAQLYVEEKKKNRKRGKRTASTLVAKATGKIKDLPEPPENITEADIKQETMKTMWLFQKALQACIPEEGMGSLTNNYNRIFKDEA